MPFSGILRRVILVRTDISEERIASIIRVAVTANVPGSPILVTLTMKAIPFSETSVCTGATWHKIQEDGIL
jgi:hypothetical protein